MSLSKKDFHHLREKLAEMVAKASAVMKETEPEEIFCLNIDFFNVK
jgi:hypothetical protein